MDKKVQNSIRIEGLEVPCVVGGNSDICSREQPLLVTVDLVSGLADRSVHLTGTCDYARVADQIGALLQFRRYRRLEQVAEELAAMLLGVHPEVEVVQVVLDKPGALRRQEHLVEVSSTWTQTNFPRRYEAARFGTVEILLETAEVGLYLLHIEPHGIITAHYHQRMHELEFRVRGEVTRCRTPLRELGPIRWSPGQIHEYANVGTSVATLFCCNEPRFIPEDEVLVENLATR